MNDLISRQAAIDAMCSACWDWCDEGVCKRVSALQDIPSAQPERKKGKWIYDPEPYPMGGAFGHYECSLCGEWVRGGETNFCPNCGADMRGN